MDMVYLLYANYNINRKHIQFLAELQKIYIKMTSNKNKTFPTLPMIILNIAEKPSVAKTISHLLTSSLNVSAPHKYTPNYVFSYNNNQMVFTSILGHLTSVDFTPQYKVWNENPPRSLFHAEIKKSINSEPIKHNLQRLAGSAQKVIIWTDCDREGENIGVEVADLILEHYPRMCIKRANFSAITLTSIEYALENLGTLNVCESQAVDARIELDLRLGSVFTRLQSLSFGNGDVISYGPCQIPTLRFVVERMRLRENFVPEKFFSLSLMVNSQDEFLWERGRVFDENLTIHMFNILSGLKSGVVEEVAIRRTEKMRPLPLRTVEFQKACASIFKISAHRVMQIAENLYNKGFISYPRTETDSFPTNFNFKEIVASLSEYQEYASKLMPDHFIQPRKGSSDDGAHLPIYPLKSGSSLQGEERKIYDYVARRFLGSISKNAVGEEWEVVIKIGREDFKIIGLKIMQRNYLEIFTYEKWNERRIGVYKKDEKVKLVDSNNTVKSNGSDQSKTHTGALNPTKGVTTAPNYITEPELISLMDKNGIGTDATIAEHIHKILSRNYVYKTGTYFIATGLGYGLICGYEEIGLENFTKPLLRSELEKNLKKICENKIQKDPVVAQEIETYIKYYDIIEGNLNILRGKVEEWVSIREAPNKENMDGIKRHKDEIGLSKGNTRGNRNSPSEDLIKLHKKYPNLKGEKNESTNNKKDFKSIQKTTVKNENILCGCKVNVKRNKVSKNNENKGREFICCENFPEGCGFFEWVEETKADEIVKCSCGYEVQRKTVQSEKNRGRNYLCCKKAHKPCKFFEWVD